MPHLGRGAGEQGRDRKPGLRHAFGPKEVIITVGVNKIAKDVEAALRQIKVIGESLGFLEGKIHSQYILTVIEFREDEPGLEGETGIQSYRRYVIGAGFKINLRESPCLCLVYQIF